MREAAKLDEDNFWLHKFRATFATRCLWAGVQGFHLLTVSSLWFQHFLMTEWSRSSMDGSWTPGRLIGTFRA
jgi:hypothetical protein